MVPLIAAGVMLLGAGIEAYGKHQDGEAAKRAAEANARMNRLAANDAIRRGALTAGRARTTGTQVIAQQQVVMGASGVDTSSGSALDIMANTRALSEMDVEMIKNNASREAWGLRTGAAQMEKQGAAAARNANWAAGGTLLGGAASFGMAGHKAGWFEGGK